MILSELFQKEISTLVHRDPGLEFPGTDPVLIEVVRIDLEDV